MWPVKQVDIKLKPEQFAALAKVLLDNQREMNQKMNHREANVDPLLIALHSFTFPKLTSTQMESWRFRQNGKLYNFKLSPGFALCIHLYLSSLKGDLSYHLKQAHERIYLALHNLFSNEMLKPSDSLLVYAYES